MATFIARNLTTLAALAAALLAGPAFAATDSITDVYGQILDNPVSAELNLQYAMIAEGRGEYRKALAAYERILVNDPGNEDARRGLQRVRRIIEPPLTQTTTEIGVTGETNPKHDGTIAGDLFGYGRFRVRDERPIAGHRWRTVFDTYGELRARATDLNYANVNADTGPLIDLDGTMMTFRPAIGGGAAAFRGSFYYWDINASAGLEGYLQGAYQWVRLRAGYRQYNPSLTSGEGWYADLMGRLTLQDVIHDRDAFSISPWLRWSGINGVPDNGGTDFATGRYIEGGATFEYAKVVSERLTAAVNVKLSDRLYDNIGGTTRQDYLLSPGASLIFRNLLSVQTDLRFDYQFEQNGSTQAAHTYQNHILKAALVVRR